MSAQMNAAEDTQTYHDRREERRHDLRGLVWCRQIGGNGDKGVAVTAVLARCRDISRGGVGLISQEPMPIGARLFIEVVSRAGNLSAVGSIKYCQPTDDGEYRSGLQLEIVPPTASFLFGEIGA